MTIEAYRGIGMIVFGTGWVIGANYFINGRDRLGWVFCVPAMAGLIAVVLSLGVHD